MITVELNGTGDGSLGSRANRMIAQDPNVALQEVEWVRAGIPVFTRRFTLQWWAKTVHPVGKSKRAKPEDSA